MTQLNVNYFCTDLGMRNPQLFSERYHTDSTGRLILQDDITDAICVSTDGFHSRKFELEFTDAYPPESFPNDGEHVAKKAEMLTLYMLSMG